MGDSTRVVKQTNVVLKHALAACAALRGQNAFLDLALDAGDRVHLPPSTKLVGYAKQEQAFLTFLKTLEPHLPKTPKTGPRSHGELLLRTESGQTWQVLFRYRDEPRVVVHRLAWLGVPLWKVRPLRVPKSASPSAGARFVDASGEFVVTRVDGKQLVVVRGAAGSKGTSTTKTFAHPRQAAAALERLEAGLRAKGFRRRSR